MDKGSNWGKCPLRLLGRFKTRGQRVGWYYICSKTGDSCDPDYCLGPDEDEKGDEDERKIV